MIYQGFALSSDVAEAPLTAEIASAMIEQLRQTEVIWEDLLTDPRDPNARIWGCYKQVDVTWNPQIDAVEKNVSFASVRLVASIPDAPEDEAYHTEDRYGHPLCLISYAACGGSWPSAMSHEIAECRCDATCLLTVNAPGNFKWAREVCDPVQGSDYVAQGTNVAVSNVVGPAYFGLAASGRLDLAGAVTAPFQQLPSGYHEQISRNGDTANIFGDRVTAEKRAYVQRVGVRGGLRAFTRGYL